MKTSILGSAVLAFMAGLTGCSYRTDKPIHSRVQATGAAPAAAAPPAAPVPAPVPAPPKTYTVAAGTPITIRTLSDVSSKSAQSGNEFEAMLESPLAVEEHMLAARGSTVMGTVAAVDQGGRAKGKASLAMTLKSIRLLSGETVAIQTNQVTQEAKSGSKENVVRTEVMSGAGVATNLATRGPAAEILPESVLTFRLAKDISIVEKAKL